MKSTTVADQTALQAWIDANPYTVIKETVQDGTDIVVLYEDLPNPTGYANKDIVRTETQVNIDV